MEETAEFFMRIQNVLIANKKTAFEHYREENEIFSKRIPIEELKFIEMGHNAHCQALQKVTETLQSFGISYEKTYVGKTSPSVFQNRDLIICVGGDGTLLTAAHYIRDDTLVLSVKSDPKSCGALCSTDAHGFPAFLEKLLKDEVRIEKWPRAQGTWDGKSDLAVNEILIGPKYRAQQARYEIFYRGMSEIQRSGGVIVTTGCGSTGWYLNIPGNLGKFDRTQEELRFILTEYAISENYKIVQGTLKKGDILRLRSRMNWNGSISFDGDTDKRLYPFYRGEEVEIQISEHPLHVAVC